MTIFVKNNIKVKIFGAYIRNKRLEKKLPLRVVAAYLDIDQAILSKIETGKRKATKEIALKIGEYFNISKEEIVVKWLSDKLVYEIEDEEFGLKALQVAEDFVKYKTLKRSSSNKINNKLKRKLSKFSKIKKAWIFGSFARGENNEESDIDIALETDTDFSYFDLAEVKEVLQNEVGMKVDIGFLDTLKPLIFNDVEKDLKLIYER